jgi:hypothetical protein
MSQKKGRSKERPFCWERGRLRQGIVAIRRGVKKARETLAGAAFLLL